MSYEEISIDGFINEIKDVSSGPHSRKFCFVLGAGASKTSGIKSGQDLVNIWDKELFERNKEDFLKWKTKLQIEEENKYSYYSQYYEKRFSRCPADGYNYLEKLMEHARPSSGYVMLSYMLSKTSHNVVITTNFDHLIEDAVNYYIQNIPLVIGHESLAHYITKQLKRPTIVKIHRDLLFDPANRVDEVETLHDNWKKALDVVFSEYHPIFIGYAGNDNSLMDYLTENCSRFKNGDLNFPYWMLYKNDKLDGKVYTFLNQSDGYCIKHDGFDEVLYLMGATFDYRMPSMENFLSDAKKRFKMLSDAIDGFTDNVSGEKLISPNAYASYENTIEESRISLAVQQITSQTNPQRIYRQAILLHKSGKYKDALKEKLKLIELEPENARYQYSLGVTLHAMGNYDEALAKKLKAVDLEPENARYHHSLGVTLRVMERYDEALSERKKAVDLEPENGQYHNGIGVTLHEMGRYDEALSEKQKAVDLEPENALYHNRLSTTLHAMGRYDEALAESQKAIDLEPENARRHNSHGTQHSTERDDEALTET